jgi:membrane protein
LLGVEFTWVYAHEYGSLKGSPRPGARSSPTRPDRPTALSQ